MKYQLHKAKVTSLLFFIFILNINSSAFSAENMPDEWKFHLAPYAWLAGQSGTVSSFGNLPPVDIDIDFWDDVVGNINGAFFLIGEAQKGKFGIMLDLAYIDIEDDNATPGPGFSSATAENVAWLVTTALEYRVAASPGDYFVDLFAGVRYWSVESTLTLNAGLLPRVKLSNEDEWFDPLVGIKAKTTLGATGFFITGIFKLGGFGVGSDLMWDASLLLGYNWTETFSTVIGYRYLDVDYDEDSFIYDIAQDGPILGLSWRF